MKTESYIIKMCSEDHSIKLTTIRKVAQFVLKCIPRKNNKKIVAITIFVAELG